MATKDPIEHLQETVVLAEKMHNAVQRQKWADAKKALRDLDAMVSFLVISEIVDEMEAEAKQIKQMEDEEYSGHPKWAR